MTLLQIAAQSTQTTVTTGTGVDVSGITGDWTLKLNMSALSDSTNVTVPVVRFQFTDTLNSFTVALAGPTISFKGTIASSYDKVKSFKKQDFPDLRCGVASALLRLDLTDIEVTGSVTYRAWIEY